MFCQVKHFESPIMGPNRAVICKMKNWMMTKVMGRVMTRLKTRMLKMSGAMRSLPVFMPVKLLSAKP